MKGRDRRKVLLQRGNIMEILPKNGFCRLSITSSMVFWGETEVWDRKVPQRAQGGFECGGAPTELYPSHLQGLVVAHLALPSLPAL